MPSDREAREERMAAAAKAMAAQGGGGERTAIQAVSGMKWMKLKPGTIRIDVLPFKLKEPLPYLLKQTKMYEPGDWFYFAGYHAHRNIGINKDLVICPAKTFGKKCPICEYRAGLAKTADPDDEKMIKNLQPSYRQVWCVWDHADPDNSPKLLDQSHFGMGKQIDAVVNGADPGDNYHLYWHPKKGFTLKCGVTEEPSGNGTWNKVSMVEFKSRSSPIDPDVLEKVPYLPSLLIEIPFDELKKKFLGLTEEDEGGTKKPTRANPDPDDDDEDDPTPPKKKPASKPVDEDEEDDDDPRPAKKPAAKKPDPDDDDEDEDEEDSGSKNKMPQWEKKQKVRFQYRDKVMVGVVVRGNNKNDVVAVQTEDREEPYNIKADELEEYKPKKPAAPADDDDDEDDPPAKPKKPAGKKPVDDEDDDDPQPAKKPAGKTGNKNAVPFDADDDDDEDELPKKPAGKKKPVDDDEDDD